MGLGWTEILVVILLIVLVFGAKRLPDLGKSLGGGIREFKKSLSANADKDDPEELTPPKPMPLDNKSDRTGPKVS